MKKKPDTPTQTEDSPEVFIALWLLIQEQQSSAKAWIKEWSMIGTLTIILIVLISWTLGFTLAFTPVISIIVVIGLTRQLIKYEMERLTAAKKAIHDYSKYKGM